MNDWNTLCWVRQTVCSQVSEELYQKYGEEIINYFQNKDDVDFDDEEVFAYCLGIVLRNEIQSAYEFKEPFYTFITAFLDAYVII